MGYHSATRCRDHPHRQRVIAHLQLRPEAYLTTMRSLKRAAALLLSSATIMVLVWPVFAQASPGGSASAAAQAIDDSATWVANHSPADLYAAEELPAASVDTIPVGTPLEVLEPQRTGRLHVYDPVSDLEGWV